MAEARERELLGAHRPAGAVGRLEHEDVAAGLGQRDRGRQPVRARADDDRRAAHPAAGACAIWCSMLCGSIGALAPEGVLGLAAGHRVGAVEVPGHRVPRSGRADERASVLLRRGAAGCCRDP